MYSLGIVYNLIQEILSNIVHMFVLLAETIILYLSIDEGCY